MVIESRSVVAVVAVMLALVVSGGAVYSPAFAGTMPCRDKTGSVVRDQLSIEATVPSVVHRLVL